MTTMVPIIKESRNLWEMTGEFDRLFDASCEVYPDTQTRAGIWHPTMDIYNKKNELTVEFEIPGIEPDDINITMQRYYLIVKGTKRKPMDYKEEEKYYTERQFADFTRVVYLPMDIESENAIAIFNNGILTVRLPKKAKQEARKPAEEIKQAMQREKRKRRVA
jgi:HSP20 family protein